MSHTNIRLSIPLQSAVGMPCTLTNPHFQSLDCVGNICNSRMNINPHYSYVTGFDKSRQIIYNNRFAANCMHAATSLLEIK